MASARNIINNSIQNLEDFLVKPDIVMSGAIHRQFEVAAAETLRLLMKRSHEWGYPTFTTDPTADEIQQFAALVKRVTSEWVMEGKVKAQTLKLGDGTLLIVAWDGDGVGVRVGW